MKGALGTAFTTWLALIALQALSSTPGAGGRVAQAFGDVDRLLERALDPTVPAIPDRRSSTGTVGKIRGRIVPKDTAGFGGGGGTFQPATPRPPRLPVPGAPLPV